MEKVNYTENVQNRKLLSWALTLKYWLINWICINMFFEVYPVLE